jgi:hypothetical protein
MEIRLNNRLTLWYTSTQHGVEAEAGKDRKMLGKNNVR